LTNLWSGGNGSKSTQKPNDHAREKDQKGAKTHGIPLEAITFRKGGKLGEKPVQNPKGKKEGRKEKVRWPPNKTQEGEGREN